MMSVSVMLSVLKLNIVARFQHFVAEIIVKNPQFDFFLSFIWTPAVYAGVASQKIHNNCHSTPGTEQ